jgi:hypothetical protein
VRVSTVHAFNPDTWCAEFLIQTAEKAYGPATRAGFDRPAGFMNLNIIFQECGGTGGGGGADDYEDGQDRVPDEVGRGGTRRRLQVEEVRQEGLEEQPQPEVQRQELHSDDASRVIKPETIHCALRLLMIRLFLLGATTGVRRRAAASRRGWRGTGTTPAML